MPYKQAAAYALDSKAAGNSVTVWRDLSLGEFYHPLEEYPALRAFYPSLERKDHDSIVLKRGGATQKAEVETDITKK